MKLAPKKCGVKRSHQPQDFGKVKRSWLGEACRSPAIHVAWRGLARRGRAGGAGCGGAWLVGAKPIAAGWVLAVPCKARLAWHGSFQRGSVRQCPARLGLLRQCSARLAWRGGARLVTARSGGARHGTARLGWQGAARQYKARLGRTVLVTARLGWRVAPNVRLCSAVLGMASSGKAWLARLVVARPCPAVQGSARLAWLARRGAAGSGSVRHGSAVQGWQGKARPVGSGQCFGEAGKSSPGRSKLGRSRRCPCHGTARLARRGGAWRGGAVARQGRARRGWLGAAVRGAAVLGSARLAGLCRARRGPARSCIDSVRQGTAGSAWRCGSTFGQCGAWRVKARLAMAGHGLFRRCLSGPGLV